MRIFLYVSTALALMFSIVGCSSESQKVEQKAPLEKALTSSKKFINPLTASKEYNEMYLDEMGSLKIELPPFIDSLLQAQEGMKMSVYFRDLNNGMTVMFDERRKYSPASLMKVPIMITAFKREELEKGFLKKKLQYTELSYAKVPNSTGPKYTDGQYYTVFELIQNIIEYSDNVGVYMLLDQLEFSAIKQVENDLGIDIPINKTELDSVIGVKAYATFFRILYNCSYLTKEHSNKALALLTESRFKEGIRRAVPKEIKVAHKYGQRDINSQVKKMDELKTDQLHHFAIVYRRHKPYLLGIMIKNDRGIEELKSSMYAVASKVDRLVQKEVDSIELSGIPSDIR